MNNPKILVDESERAADGKHRFKLIYSQHLCQPGKYSRALQRPGWREANGELQLFVIQPTVQLAHEASHLKAQCPGGHANGPLSEVDLCPWYILWLWGYYLPLIRETWPDASICSVVHAFSAVCFGDAKPSLRSWVSLYSVDKGMRLLCTPVFYDLLSYFNVEIKGGGQTHSVTTQIFFV